MDANPEKYLDRCEAGEMFLVEQPDGRLIAMVPEDQFKNLVPKEGERVST